MADNLTFRLDVDSSQATQSINTFFNTFEQGAARAKSTLNKELGQSIQTEVKVEFKNGELVAKKVQSIRQESNKLGEVWKAVNGKLGKTPNELKRQSSILKQLRGDTQKYANGTRQVTREWQALTQRIKAVDAAQRRMSGQNFLNGFAGRFAAVQTAANLATSAIMGMVRGVQELAATAARMEVLQLQLEAFTGGAENARNAFDQFVEIAANSPLNLEQVSSAGKIMMAFGIEADKAVKATKQLAVVSAATGGDINLLARNLGQIAAQGRAYTRDLTQFAIQGIPIWQELSTVTGYSTVALKEMAREGKIGFAEVSAALDNMTRKGSQFNEIAERMQETFSGRLQRIQAAFQKLALEAVNSFNRLDQAMGNLVSGSMKLFADVIFGIANNFDKITIAVAAATAATIAFFTVQKWGAIIAFIGTAVQIVTQLANAKRLAAVAAATLQGILGNFGAVAAGLAAGAIAAGALSVAFSQASTDAGTADGAVQNLNSSLGKLSEKEKEMAAEKFDYRVVQYQQARTEADRYRAELDREVEKLQEIKGEIKKRYEEERTELQDTLTSIKDKLTIEKDALRDAKTEIKARYDEEKIQLDETLAKIREKYQEEIGALQEMGPKQKELYEYEKRKLIEQIKSGKLQGEALLKAQARLERMEQQEKIAKLRKQQAKEEEPILDRLKQAEQDRKTAVEEVTQRFNDRITAIENEKTTVEQQIRDAEQAYKDEVKAIDDSIQATKRLETQVDISTEAVKTQVTIVQNLTGKWREAETAARRYAAAVRAANAAESQSNSGARASGGPVSGGSTYTVNELGKEAFLSASGKLSMINAPAFGDWKAPGHGTVIPAHLTKQLDIPSGGINLNSAAKRNSAMAGSSGNNVASIARAIAGSMSGDTISNQVTIQSANPNQTANSVMVQLAKLKRVRYS